MDGRATPPVDEARLADFTSGLLSLAAGVAGLAALALPHAPRQHLGWEPSCDPGEKEGGA